ncbi:hypothetical protein [Sodalis-like endosymbiont of Proechinophthirus fluctus]|uniref:hypothetical protein n=1 Tax=Sodalis-like endosymbiont of Proechinophthirus fluctus TaxID=1462730 RepID=UPI001650D2AD|nr:hypothetical protein [Sodalis-like endosymbiont of Proechinophthirus fluctus]
MRLQNLSHYVTMLTRNAQLVRQTLGPEIATMTTLDHTGADSTSKRVRCGDKPCRRAYR